MSIGAKPWEGAGGAASVPDASETTKGKIRIATTAESTAGLDDLTAMTPAKVKARIDASISGGIEYKGTFDASTGLPSLANAEQGDLYKVSVAGIIYGKSWAVGDHLLINADMGGTVTPSKIDKVDNTESVTSVNGQTGATSLGIGDLNNVVISGGGAGGDLVEYDAVDGRWENVTKSTINVGDFNDDSTYQLRDAGLTSIAGLTTSADKMLYTTGSDAYDVTGLTAAGRALLDDADAAAQRTTLGVAIGTDVQAHDAQLDDVAGLTPADGAVIIGDGANFVTESGATARASLGLTIGTDVQAYDAQLADVAGLTPADGAFIVGDGVNFVTETLATARTSLGLGTAATADTGDFLASTAGINDLSDVTITSVTNGQVISYNSTSGEWENSTPASGGATDLDGLSDVTITSASSGQILRNNGSGQFVNVALSIVDDPSPQLGGALDVNGQAITSASNGNVTINPDGTGDISVGADIIPDADATHTLGSEDNRFITLHSELNGAVQFKARNETGGALTKGQAVYISGISGDVPLVSLARANSASTMPAHGLLAANVSNNADVQVISFGNLTAYNTTTHSLSLGDTVYVSAATAGALTSSAPAGETNLIQNIGKVVRASATEGIIKVGGAGRSAATPNLDQNKIFLGNASNQAVSTALSSINLTSFNDDLGSTYQPLDAQLTDVAGLTPADGAVIIGDGANFITESGATARASLGLTIGTDVQAYDAQLADVAGLTPADGAFIVGDGANFVTESGATARTSLGAIAELSEDSSPQLGGDLDVNANEIISASNNNVVIRPNGTGHVFLGGNTNPAEIRLYCEVSDQHYVGFKSAAHADYGTSIVWELPAGDGSANQVLKTDGSGVLSWVDQSGGGGGGGFTYSAVSTATTAQAQYHYSVTGTTTITLPAASGVTAGQEVRVKVMGADTVTVSRSSTDTIDGQTSITMAVQYQALNFISNGSNGWEII